jgi:RNA polymerase sigma-70 factor (family 1)
MKDQLKNKTDKDDFKWVRKAKRGNHKAFEKLVIKYQKPIYYSIRKMVLDHDDTNDIVQDTFVKAYSNMHRFDEQFPFYPWLHRIAVNTAINYRTKKSRFIENLPDPAGKKINESILAKNNPLDDFLEKELKSNIAEALERLPVEQRVVFVMRTSEDLSYQEIGEQLDISIGTVMSRLSRARSKLRELLQHYLSDNNFKV